MGIFENNLKESIAVKKEILANKELCKQVNAVSKAIVKAMKKGNTLFVAGNGGSACDAMHVAGEFVNYFNFVRDPLPCVALTSNAPVITAIGNDVDFNQIFVKQLKALAHKGDIFIGITTSGNSKDVLEAFKYAKENNILCVCLNGKDGGEISRAAICDFDIVVPSNSTPRIQEAHLVIEHTICHVVEEEMFGK